MIIKYSKYSRSLLTTFDLLGYNEVGLSKAFAYIIANDPHILYTFLRFIGISIKNTMINFHQTQIAIEKKREEGRTDIEIRQKGKYHVIIESKINKNKLLRQRTQYLKAFEKEKQKCVCFITQVNDYQKQVTSGIIVRNIGWIEIADILNSKKFQHNSLVRDFLKYFQRGYSMADQKEILVQDLSDPVEMKKYKEYQIYRRERIFGSPLYFSPYFTKNANQAEGIGISYISKILGIISTTPKEIRFFNDDILVFADGDRERSERWIKGVELDGKSRRTYTYFFLGTPVKLEKPLLKDGTIKKGRGRKWIAAQIPPNHCVNFDEFVKRIQKR